MLLFNSNVGQVIHTYMPPSPSNIIWYSPKGNDGLWQGKYSEAWQKLVATYCWVYDEYDLQANCLESGINSEHTLNLGIWDYLTF